MKKNKKVLCIILDGWGIGKAYKGNAIHLAKTPIFDKLWHSAPRAVLAAAGEEVGLPAGQMGTSEVNHMAIGAGRIIFQDLVKINKAVKSRSFHNNPAFIDAFEYVKKNNSTLHIKGLVSPGGIHSHSEHLYALLKAAKLYGLTKVYIHIFTDGRDTLPESAISYIQELEDRVKEIGLGKIASISGRYYAMDRDHNWDRTDRAFTLLTAGAKKKKKSAVEAVKASYKKGITDEFIEPTAIEVEPGEEGTIASNDAVIFVNFRSDRPRQLVERFLKKGPKNLKYVTMTQYSPDYDVQVAYPLVKISNSLGEVLSKKGVKQLRITETEKFAHLTFFLNGKQEEAFEGEDRIMLDSYSDIATHDKKPEMRTPDIVKQIIQDMKANNHQVIFTNLCNADMVGHSGGIKATIKAAEVVDKALADLLPVAKKKGYDVILIADHGNAEEMWDEMEKSEVTAHSTNPVPFILISKEYKELKKDEGGLDNVAPTILKILGIKKPKEMTGESLV